MVKLAAITKSSTMTNFIVPVDFSVDSLKGLEWALLFSQKQTITIQMVYVLTNSSNFQPSVPLLSITPKEKNISSGFSTFGG